MWKEIKVLVIDDDEKRRHDLKVILDFVGEVAIGTAGDNWKEAVEGEDKENVGCLILGAATDVAKVDLYPVEPDQLGDVGGFNATLLHDCNVMNLFIDLGKSKEANVFDLIQKEDIDFSSLILPEAKVEEDGRKRLMNLDLETSLYIMILFLVFLFDEDVAESAANSLTLDEGVLTILSNMTGDKQYQNWSPYRYTNHVFWPNDPALGLQKHMVIFEYIYTRLLMQKNGIKNPLDLEV